MTISPINESGMTFGPYPDGRCFYIEKSRTYADLKQGVPIAEFLLLRDHDGKPPIIWVVEAKSSAPKPASLQQFDEYILKIREKLVNAFSLGWASCLNRHREAEEELPSPFKSLDLSQTGVRFVLVISGHKESWLPPIQDALKYELHSTIKTWCLGPTSVAVMNEELAMQHGLILPAQQGPITGEATGLG